MSIGNELVLWNGLEQTRESEHVRTVAVSGRDERIMPAAPALLLRGPGVMARVLGSAETDSCGRVKVKSVNNAVVRSRSNAAR